MTGPRGYVTFQRLVADVLYRSDVRDHKTGPVKFTLIGSLEWVERNIVMHYAGVALYGAALGDGSETVVMVQHEAVAEADRVDPDWRRLSPWTQEWADVLGVVDRVARMLDT